MRENIKVRKLTFDNVKRARALAPITICGGKDRQPRCELAGPARQWPVARALVGRAWRSPKQSI